MLRTYISAHVTGAVAVGVGAGVGVGVEVGVGVAVAVGVGVGGAAAAEVATVAAGAAIAAAGVVVAVVAVVVLLALTISSRSCNQATACTALIILGILRSFGFLMRMYGLLRLLALLQLADLTFSAVSTAGTGIAFVLPTGMNTRAIHNPSTKVTDLIPNLSLATSLIPFSVQGSVELNVPGSAPDQDSPP